MGPGRSGGVLFIAHHTFCSRAGSQRDAGLARFLRFQGYAVLITDLANKAVVDVDPHHRFAINDFLLMHNHLFDQCVQEFFGQFGEPESLDQGHQPPVSRPQKENPFPA